MKKSFDTFLKADQFILHCGSTGSVLMALGGKMPSGVNNLIIPETVQQVHKSYVDAGAKILLTNTFSMNPIYAKIHADNCDWQAINRRGVEIAQAAAGDKAYVIGNIGPTGELLKPFGPMEPETVFEAYKAQAQVLADGGVDGFSVQTFYHLEELKIAVRAIRSFSDLPIMVSMVYGKKGATLMGDTIMKTYEELMPLGIDVLGHNCGNIDIFTIGDILAPLAKISEIPISACPNAGLPENIDGRAVYMMTPAEFRTGIIYLKSKNIRILGGCCGVNIDHIKAIADLF